MTPKGLFFRSLSLALPVPFSFVRSSPHFSSLSLLILRLPRKMNQRYKYQNVNYRASCARCFRVRLLQNIPIAISGFLFGHIRKFDASCCMWNELKQMNADLQPLPIVTTEQIHKTTSLSSLLLSVALAPSPAHSSLGVHVQCIVRFLKSERKKWNEGANNETRDAMESSKENTENSPTQFQRSLG